MATTHTEAVLNKLGKSELVQLVLQTEASLVSQITNRTTEVKDLLGYFKKLDADLAVTKNANSKLMERVVQTERQCQANAHYSRRDTVKVTDIHTYIRDQDLEGEARNIFEAIGVNKCRKLRANQKLHQFYTINGIVRVKLEENCPPKSVTHMLDLVNPFPDIEIDSV